MAHSRRTLEQIVARTWEFCLLPAVAIKELVSPPDATADTELPYPSAPAPEFAIESESALLDRLWLTAYACRKSRWPMSLALIEIDEFPKLILTHGPRQAARLARLVHDLCGRRDAAQTSFVPLRQYRFALALADCNHRTARRLCQRLVHDASLLVPADVSTSGAQLSLSIGLSSVPSAAEHFSPQALFKSASLCLWGAQLAGGGTIKSTAPS